MDFLKNDKMEYGLIVGFIFFLIFMIFSVKYSIALLMSFLITMSFWLIQLSYVEGKDFMHNNLKSVNTILKAIFSGLVVITIFIALAVLFYNYMS